MNEIVIIHNPRCSKSRETLKLLEERSIKPKIIDYLSGQLDEKLLNKVVAALKLHPRKLLRTKEEEFKLLNIDLENENQVIQAILQHPVLLERPIVLIGTEAVIGRPPENIYKLLD